MGKFIKEMGLAAMMLAVSGVSASGKGNTRYYQAAVDTDAVWVATSGGLMRFDKSTGEQNTFASQGFNDITAVTVADGLVFAGGPGYRGVATFKDNLFSGIDFDTIHTQNVKSIVFADGLWVGASQMILHRLPNEEDEKFDGPEPTSSFYSFQTLAWSKEDSRMWFGVQSNTKGDKLGYVDGNSLKFIPGSSANISGLCVLEDGTVVAATEKGMMKYSDGKYTPFEHTVSAMPAECSAVACDGDVIWFAAGNVLVRGEGFLFNKFSCKSVNDNDAITSIIPDGDTVWVTFLDGGLKKFVNDEFMEPTTGVEEVLSDKGCEEIYDLEGRKVRVPEKGRIYVRQGKKYLQE